MAIQEKKKATKVVKKKPTPKKKTIKKLERKKCVECNKLFTPKKKTVKICSRECISKYNQKNAGRPSAVDENVLAKLEEAFMMSFTDEEACLYCDISPSTLYRYIEDNPDFRERKEALKKQPNIDAKVHITKSIKGGDLDDVKRWLERKAKNEFSTKQEIDNHISGDMEITHKEEQKTSKLKQMLSKFT